MNAYVRPRNGGFLPRAQAADGGRAAEVSVVMVVYRTGPALNESIARVLADPDVAELVIVDNGSSLDEEAVQDRAARDPRVILKRGHGNVGFARGANMGSHAAHGRLLVFLNPDAFLQPGCIRALRSGLAGRPAPCIVGARVLNIDGTEQRGARRGEITPVTALLSLTRLSQRLRAFRDFEVHHESDPVSRGPEPVPTISGACFAVSAIDFEALGGFDESYFLHVEDVDLCWRARRSGGLVLFDPEAEVIHLGSTSLKAPVVVEFWKGVGLARYFRKRADNRRRRVIAILLTPVIIAVSVARPILRGQAFRNRSGLRSSELRNDAARRLELRPRPKPRSGQGERTLMVAKSPKP